MVKGPYFLMFVKATKHFNGHLIVISQCALVILASAVWCPLFAKLLCLMLRCCPVCIACSVCFVSWRNLFLGARGQGQELGSLVGWHQRAEKNLWRLFSPSLIWRGRRDALSCVFHHPHLCTGALPGSSWQVVPPGGSLF
jgi:hypothetical protein